jgi:hypothetical protein
LFQRWYLLLYLLELVLGNLLSDWTALLWLLLSLLLFAAVDRDELDWFPARLDRDRDEGLLPGSVLELTI